jgi:hypothetical protein
MYLDFILKLSSPQTRDVTLFETTRLTYAIIVLTKVSAGVPELKLSAEQLREISNVSYYLDALIERMRELSDSFAIYSAEDNTHNAFWHLKPLFETARKRYEHQIQQTSSGQNVSGIRVGADEFSPFDLVALKDQDMEPALESDPIDLMECSEEEFWSQMLVGWPMSLKSFQ